MTSKGMTSYILLWSSLDESTERTSYMVCLVVLHRMARCRQANTAPELRIAREHVFLPDRHTRMIALSKKDTYHIYTVNIDYYKSIITVLLDSCYYYLLSTVHLCHICLIYA